MMGFSDVLFSLPEPRPMDVTRLYALLHRHFCPICYFEEATDVPDSSKGTSAQLHPSESSYSAANRQHVPAHQAAQLLPSSHAGHELAVHQFYGGNKSNEANSNSKAPLVTILVKPAR